jgi:hypothetical protein
MIDNILNLAKTKKIDINFSLREVTKATKILKKISLAMDIKPDELFKLFNTDGVAFFGKINSFLADDYDDEKDQYGELSKQFLELIKGITKSQENLEDLQILDIFQKVQDIVKSLNSEGQESFLQDTGTTLPSITEQSDTTEKES